MTEEQKARQNAGDRKRRAAFVAEGRCPECAGKKPLAPGHKKCWDCLDWYRLWRREYNANRMAAGICTRCGKPNDRPGLNCCAACKERETELAKEWRERRG